MTNTLTVPFWLSDWVTLVLAISEFTAISPKASYTS